MIRTEVSGLARMSMLSMVLLGCGGLDATRGTLVSVEGNQYTVRDSYGKEARFLADKSTRIDPILPGDEVRVYATKDGQAAYIYKIEGEQGGSGSAIHESHHEPVKPFTPDK